MRKSLFPLGVLCLASIGLAQETGYNTNWSGHRTLHVNTLANSRTATTISAPVLKYPMLVRLGQADSAIFAAAKAGGADVRFTKSNNTTRLQHSIETWDATNRVGAIWVLLDTVYANNQTQNFRMHWGNPAAVDSSKPNAVFDSANGFEAVWHMGNASGATPRPNSVLGGNPATPAGTGTASMNPLPGLIGLADTLRSANNNAGNDDHFTLGSGYRFSQGAGTMSMWTRFAPVGSWNNMIALSNGTGTGGGQTQGGMSNNIWFGRDGSTNNLITRSSIKVPAGNGFFTADSGLEGTARVAGGALAPNNVWAHFTLTFSDSGRRRTLYKDGAMLADFPALAAGVRANDSINLRNTVRDVERTQTFLGRSQWGDRNYRGTVDEVRISKVARSADWIALDYASQNPAQSLVTDSVAPVIAYAQDTIRAEAGFPIPSILPAIFTGIPQPTIAVDVALPSGLALTTGNTNRGMIAGNYTGTASGTTRHIITATNGKGTFSDTIYITVTANAENYTTWANTRTLSFNSPASATVTRFPFLVRLGAADSAVFSGAGANGASLRFSRTDAIKLSYSIDHWDAANRRAAIWVLMDQVTAGANTLRMHWGNGSATSQSNASRVFTRDNGYVTVHHMGNPAPGNDTLNVRPNSVQPGVNDARPVGFSTGHGAGYAVRLGNIGMADSLANPTFLNKTNGGDFFDFDSLPASRFTEGGQATMSIWVKADTLISNGFMQYYTIGNTVSGLGNGAMWLGKNGTASFRLAAQNITAGTNSGVTASSVNGTSLRQVWQHVTFTVAGAVHRLYSNGTLLATNTAGQPLASVLRTANYIGAATWPDPTFPGMVDEARLSNVARDSNWIKLEYETQRPGAMPLGTLTYAAISGAPGTAITPRSPSVAGAVSYSYVGTLPAGISFNDTTGVISGTPTGPGSATITVTANAGVWSSSGTVTMNFGAVDGNYATAWAGRRYVSVNTGTAGVGPATATERNFPVLVRLGTADAAIFTASQRSGADIRFTKLDNVTRLKHEIEHWDSAGRSAAIWVKLDTVYGSTNGSRFRMHYGNLLVADSSQPGAVFDSANGFVGVWHMGGTSGAQVRANAVPGGNPAVPSGSTANLASGWTARAGVIGLADSLRSASASNSAANRAADDHLNLGTGKYANFTTGLTISMWAKPIEATDYTGWTQYISFSNGSANNNIWMGRQGNTLDHSAEIYDGTTSWGHIHASGVQTYGAWQLLTYTVTATGQQTLYRNGVMGAEQAGGGVIPNIERTQNHIGRSPWSDRNYLGGIDEVRVSRVARSANWVKLEYANQNPTQNLIALTDNLVPITTSINAASTLLAGEALSFKAVNNGLLFQIQGEAAARARLAIVDMQGRVVWSRNVNTAAGMTQVFWNGASNMGQGVGAGVYVVRMSLLDDAGKTTHRLDKKVPLAR